MQMQASFAGMLISMNSRFVQLCSIALAASLLLGSQLARAEDTVTVKGKTKGGSFLLNPVWNEAKDPKNHRYTFRYPSTTVSKNAKILRAALSKELAIVALTKTGKAKALGRPVVMHVSGGRTSPTTLVITEGQNIEFRNHDPFPHKLHDTAKQAGGLGPEETPKGKSRVWLPPKAGTYEIRDALFPSIRSWVIVEPRAVKQATVDVSGAFNITKLAPGDYELKAYFNGKSTGESMAISVNAKPDVVNLKTPLVVAKAKTKKGEK